MFDFSELVKLDHLATFGLGLIGGASLVFYFLKIRKKIHLPVEELFEFPDLRDEYRLILAVRNDLKMGKGKVAAQCGHASVAAYAKAQKEQPVSLKRWMRYGGTKITVRIDSEEELLELNRKAKTHNVLSSIVRDAGQTQVAPGSRTVIALGPAPKSLLEKISGHLKLY